MNEPMDERYANFREHAELRERTATLEATMLQVGPTLARIETMVASRPTAPAPQETAAALALHRAVDAMDNMRKNNNGSSPFLIGLALIGACAITAGVMYFVFHH